jgi:hypothetical protein
VERITKVFIARGLIQAAELGKPHALPMVAENRVSTPQGEETAQGAEDGAKS